MLYVDDIALFAKDFNAIAAARTQLMQAYKMRDLGELRAFIGVQVVRLRDKVFIHQEDYCRSILEKYGFTGQKTVRTPFEDKVVLKPREDQCPETQLKKFQEMLGSAGWLVTQTRLDIAYAVNKLAQFNANPSDLAQECMNHLYRYLNGTMDLGILFEKGSEILEGYTDSNWGDPNSLDKRSTSGYVFTLANAPISWSSRKQRTTATSTTEAEYIAQCNATKEAVYLRQFLQELGYHSEKPTIIHADNTGAIALAKNTVNHARTRHIEFQYHYTREKEADGAIKLSYIPTVDMIADGLTKPLNSVKFAKFREQIGMKSLKDVMKDHI